MVMTTRAMLLACMALCLATATAEPRIENNEVTLQADRGVPAEELYEKIRRRAVGACRTHAIAPHFQARYERACRREFVTEAVRRFDRPALTALHERETGDSRATDSRLAERR